MHEFGMTYRIVEAAKRSAKENRANRVLRVDLLMGQFTFLNPRQVKSAYKILRK